MKTSVKRVLMIAPTPFFADRGCHVHIAEQVWALQRQGLEVLVATYGLGRDLPDIATARTWHFPWYTKQAVGPSWHKFYVDVFLLFTAVRAAWRFRPDVIHGHLHEGCFIGWIVSRLFGISLIFDCQGSLTGELIAHNFPLVRPQALQRMWYSFERWLDGRADGYLVQSSSMHRELAEMFGVPAEKIATTCDGVNAHFFTPGIKDLLLLARLNIPPQNSVIVFLGVLTPYQGIDDLLAAFPLVLRKVPGTILLIMGYPNVEAYKRRAQELGILDAVRFTGRIPYEDAARYLALGDIAVSPKRSQTEANGKIYNYMACGLPTVAFDTVVNRDILGELGVYVGQVGDRQQLANTIVDLLQDTQRRSNLADQVRYRAVERYSWDMVAQRIRAAYERTAVPWQLRVFAVSVRKKEKWHWVQPHLQATLHARSDARCLDVGCGVGTLSVLMEHVGRRWEFTETDPAAAAETRAIVHGHVLEADIFDKRLGPGRYDIITIFDVIEHVPNPHAFLMRASELLAPGGMLILTTPADDGRLYLVRRVADRLFGIDKEAHGHATEGFSRARLEELCRQTGLTPEQCKSFSFFFTEVVELMYNAAYILKNRARQTTSGYNLALSPASGSDVARHHRHFVLVRLLYPVLRGISLLDRLIPASRGYEWGLVAVKRTD